MNFYTYIYYDPSRNNEPIYVGMGQKNRAWDHLRAKRKSPFIQRLQFMKKNNIKPNIGIYTELDREFALFLEEELIAKLGRKDLKLGPLLNLTNGGEGGTGRVWTDEQRLIFSANRTGDKSPLFGTKQSEDTKLKIGKSQPSKRIYSKKSKEYMTARQLGDKNVMFGKLPKNTIPITYDGKEYVSIKSAAKAHNILYQTFYNRLKKEQV